MCACLNVCLMHNVPKTTGGRFETGRDKKSRHAGNVFACCRQRHFKDRERERERLPSSLSPSCIPIFSFNHSCLQVWLTVSLLPSLPLSLSPSTYPSVFLLNSDVHSSPVMRLQAKFTERPPDVVCQCQRSGECIDEGQTCHDTQLLFISPITCLSDMYESVCHPVGGMSFTQMCVKTRLQEVNVREKTSRALRRNRTTPQTVRTSAGCFRYT